MNVEDEIYPLIMSAIKNGINDLSKYLTSDAYTALKALVGRIVDLKKNQSINMDDWEAQTKKVLAEELRNNRKSITKSFWVKKANRSENSRHKAQKSYD